MKKPLVLLGAGALALGLAAAACKKEEKKQSEATGDPAARTAETTQPPAETPPEPAAPKAPTAEEKVKFYQDCTDALNAKDWDKFGSCYAEDVETVFVDQTDGELKSRAEMLEKGAKVMAGAFPDLKLTPQIILQNGDKVASIIFMSGTHTEPLRATGGELPPTKKKIGVYSLHVVQLAPDKLEVIRSWQLMDEATLAGQLGLYKGPHRPAVEKGFADQPIVVVSQPDSAVEKANLEQHKQAAAAFEKRDIKGMMDSWADDAKMMDMAMPSESDRKKAEAFTKELFKGFPDAKSEPVDVWTAGDYVVSINRNTGTNKGPMPSMKIKKPTGKSINFTQASIVRVENGKVVQGWGFWNSMALVSQLGS
jgi:predicted ester cyclase